jgi:GNAT superfamily N-acetyltransferase
VEPEARGRGYGRAALEALHAWAREHGFERVGLHVFGSNEVARRLYLRTGYVETDVMMEKRL